MAVIDLNNLPEEVLLYSNDQFYQFIEDCLGVDEMNLVKIQCIKSIRTLMNVPNVFSVLNLKCKELIDLKSRLCFVDDEDSNRIVIKAGVQTGFDDLIAILKEKNKRNCKSRKNSKLSSTTPIAAAAADLSSSAYSINASNFDSINPLLTSTPAVSTVPKSASDYIEWIVDSIEKFSIGTFDDIVLKHIDDYVIRCTVSDASVDAYIQCGCKTNIKVAFRPNTQSFQLSSFYKHVREGRCGMMKKRKHSLVKLLKSIIPSPDTLLKDAEGVSRGTDDDFDSDLINITGDSIRITTNDSISSTPNSYIEKRAASSVTSDLDGKRRRYNERRS